MLITLQRLPHLQRQRRRRAPRDRCKGLIHPILAVRPPLVAVAAVSAAALALALLAERALAIALVIAPRRHHHAARTMTTGAAVIESAAEDRVRRIATAIGTEIETEIVAAVLLLIAPIAIAAATDEADHDRDREIDAIEQPARRRRRFASVTIALFLQTFTHALIRSRCLSNRSC